MEMGETVGQGGRQGERRAGTGGREEQEGHGHPGDGGSATNEGGRKEVGGRGEGREGMHMWCQHRECNQPIRQPSKVATVQLGTCACVRTAKTLYFHHQVYGGGGGGVGTFNKGLGSQGGGGRREEGAAELESVTVTGLTDVIQETHCISLGHSQCRVSTSRASTHLLRHFCFSPCAVHAVQAAADPL